MVRIITDTTSDFEPWEYEKWNVTPVSLYINFDDQVYEENVDITKEMFWELLEKSSVNPKTSQPSPQVVEDTLREAMEAGDEAIFITISSGLSGTYQSICMIKEQLEYENCYVFDSLTGTGGHRILVEQAAKMRDQGKNAKEIVAELEYIRDHLNLTVVMDTLEYLMRGGRISRSTYAVGTLINIKPIMHVSPEGKPEVPAKVRGMRKGIAHLCKQVQMNKPDPNYPFYLMYTKDRRNALSLQEALKEIGYDIPDENIVPVGAAIGTHIGPYAVATVYVDSE